MKSVVLGKVTLAVALTWSALSGCNCNPPPETFDAMPPRRDTGFVPFDAAGTDTSTTTDAATGTDTTVTTDSAVLPDTAAGTDSTTGADSATGSDGATGVDSSTPSDAGAGDGTSGDAAQAPGRGELCTQGSCNAPYTCVIPQGQTQGYCLQACTGTCAGRNQMCMELDPSVPGTFCLDQVPRGLSCFDVYQVCASGTDCYVTGEDAQGNPTEALCKQTCEVGGSDCRAANEDAGVTAEACIPSGYVDLEYDTSDNPVMCDTDAAACGNGFECMALQTSDGRTVHACAKSLGWCGAAGGPGDPCNEDQDQYCGDIVDSNTGNTQEPAFGICDNECWYICFIPGQYTSSGDDVSYDCPTGMACVVGGPYSDVGVKVCDHGFDAGPTPDAAGIDTAATPDAGTPDVAGTDAAGSDAATTVDAGCTPCGNVTFIGACGASDEVLTWCGNNGCLQTFDCATASIGGAPLHCAEFNTSWGFDCLAGAGQPCNPQYPEQPTNPTAPTSPGCDPAIGTCSPTTFICGPVADGGVVTPDAAGVDSAVSTDGGTTCLPCVLGQDPVEGYGACDPSSEELWWCYNNCLYGIDCADHSRTCYEVTVQAGTDTFPWADCFGDTGDACVAPSTYFQNPDLSWNGNYWLCSPGVTCNTSTNVCE